MFNRKQEQIDELNARNIELAKQLRDTRLENKQLKEVRLIEIRNNTELLTNNLSQENKELVRPLNQN